MATDNWYTSDLATLGIPKKGSSFRRSDLKYETADLLETDIYVEGRLFEPIGIATPTGQSGNYLGKYRTTSFVAGRWQETCDLQTARQLFPAMGVCSTTEATPNVHAITLRTTQTPLNMGRHWERRKDDASEYEVIDMLGMSMNAYHAECSEAFPNAIQQGDWNVNNTLNTDATTDDITLTEHTDEPFKWNMFTFPIFSYNSEDPLEGNIIGWSFDIFNTIRVTGLDSGARYEQAKYIPPTSIITTLELRTFGRNIYELIRKKLEDYDTDLDTTVKCSRDTSTDYIQWTHDKLYCQPYTLAAQKRPGSVERYFLAMNQLNTGSLAIEAKDAYNNNYYENP